MASERTAPVSQPTLAIAGGASPPVMRDTAASLARVLPDARAVTLDGATHDLDPARLGPLLANFF